MLWLLVAVLLLRGLASVLEPREPAKATPAPVSTPAPWPTDDARAFAADFTRAYLSYRPAHAEESARAVQAFAAPELASSIAPEYDGDAKRRTVNSVVVARSAALDAKRALVTVVKSTDEGTRYLSVPVAQDDHGGLVVSDLPSFAAAPARAEVEATSTEPLPASERAAIEPVVSRFLTAYVGGDAAELEYLAAAQGVGLCALAAAGGDGAVAARHSVGRVLVDVVTGELRQARIVTGVDDHSRYCVLARVVERATGRAICLAFSEALVGYAAPEEVLTDNGKQFSDRFGRGGEVLFEKICRRNGNAHRLTAPRSPTTTGKIERFHQTLRREWLNDAVPFTSVLEAQAALDDWVRDYNAERPHQALEQRGPVTPADRFEPAPAEQRGLLGLWLPAQLAAVPEPQRTATAERGRAGASRAPVAGGPVELDCVVSPSGNVGAMRRQFWLGPHRAGQTVRFWASVDVIHLTIGGRAGQEPALTSQRRRSRPARRRGRRFGGPPPLPPAEDEAVIEVDRAVVNNSGLVGLAGKQVLAAEIVGGRPVIVRIEPQTLMFLDPETRELLKGRSQPAHARAGDPAAGRAARRPAAADRAGDRLSAASAPPV